MARNGNGPERHKTVIVVPEGQQAAMEGKGFAKHPCSGNHKGEAEAYRAKLCEFAAKAPQGAQEQFRRDQGASAQELCEAANVSVGP
jgi:hypothetical protein